MIQLMTALYFADIYVCCCEVTQKHLLIYLLDSQNDKFAVIKI